LPPARFWTLYAADASMTALAPAAARPAGIHSQQVLRLPGNVVSVAVSPHPMPGNWIATSGRGAMEIVLTLYDTSIVGSTGLADVTLPQVIRGRCDA
jgi:hypothetical protein